MDIKTSPYTATGSVPAAADDVLELFSLLMHLGPAHAHHLNQKQLDEAVTP